MVFADEIFRSYTEMYENITETEWIEMSSRYNIDTNLMKDIFRTKEGEYELLVEFVNEWVSEYPYMLEFLERTGGQDLLEYEVMKQVFFQGIHRFIEEEGPEMLVEDPEPAYWTTILAESMLMMLYDMLEAALQVDYADLPEGQ